jgi:hypothetical protein
VSFNENETPLKPPFEIYRRLRHKKIMREINRSYINSEELTAI